MLYNEENHTLSFTEVLDRANEDRETDFIPTTDNVKCVNIDDIAEIRPGAWPLTPSFVYSHAYLRREILVHD